MLYGLIGLAGINVMCNKFHGLEIGVITAKYDASMICLSRTKAIGDMPNIRTLLSYSTEHSMKLL